jgi:hypothetical protein
MKHAARWHVACRPLRGGAFWRRRRMPVRRSTWRPLLRRKQIGSGGGSTNSRDEWPYILRLRLVVALDGCSNGGLAPRLCGLGGEPRMSEFNSRESSFAFFSAELRRSFVWVDIRDAALVTKEVQA